LAIEDGNNDDGEKTFHWQAVALVTMYSHPDHELLNLSHHTVSSCTHLTEDVCVIDAKSITDVVGMVPHKPTLPSGSTENRYFLVEKPGLDIATFGLAYEGLRVNGGAAEDHDHDEDDE
ncbi:hypothetical protein EDD22DRAFT_783533, partial [Suillus occidentalis]